MASLKLAQKAVAIALSVQVLLLVSHVAFTAPQPPQGQRSPQAHLQASAPASRRPGLFANSAYACSAAVGMVLLAAAASRRHAQRQATACRALSVGSPVTWNGKPGTVRYVGPAKFAGGEWIGVELSVEGGMHNGTVMGNTYFECPAGRGIFTQEAQLISAGAAPAPAAPAPVAAPAAAGSPATVSVGSKVTCFGKEGVVKYVGATKFAAGEWVGVELVSGGMHNGTVLGVTYFECAPQCGVFVQASALS